MIEFKTFFHGWCEITEEQAVEHYKNLKKECLTFSNDEKRQYFNENKIRGAYIDENENLQEYNKYLELGNIMSLEDLYDCLSEAYHDQCPIELLAENGYWIDNDNDGEFKFLDNGMIKITHINFFDPENPPLFM